MFLTLRKDTQKVSISGIDQPDADVMQITKDYLAIKVPGRNYTVNMRPGRHTEYIPVEIQVWKIKDQKDYGEVFHLTADKIMEFPANKSKKK